MYLISYDYLDKKNEIYNKIHLFVSKKYIFAMVYIISDK